MVIPRSRSRSMESRTCAIISRWLSAPVTSKSRSANVDLPWAMCAIIQKFLINAGSMRYDEAEPQVSHMSYSQIAFTVAGDGIALLTMNRPQKLNALNAETFAELNEAFSSVESDPHIRAIVITGAGEKAFVAGADIKELSVLNPVEAQQLSLRGQKTFRRLELMNKPSVAAINGFALGGGLELAMACTLRVASTNAKLGQP